MDELSGKTAFITGGAQGIGLGIAHAAAAEGMQVAIVDIDEAALADAEVELSKTTKVVAARLDVRDRDAYASVADAVEAKLGPVSLLCNNAGVSGQAPVTSMSYETYDWTMGINVNGVYNGLQTFVPRMIERGGGTHIVNTASVAGLLGTPGYLYAASKFAVVGLSESLQLELAPHGIGVGVLCPSAVNTKIIDHTLDGLPDTGDDGALHEGLDEFFAFFRTHLAGGSDPDDVGRMVLAVVHSKALHIMTDATAGSYIVQRAEAIAAAQPTA